MQPTDYYLPCVGSKAANRNAPGANRTRKLLTCPLHGGSKAEKRKCPRRDSNAQPTDIVPSTGVRRQYSVRQPIEMPPARLERATD